MESLQVFYSGRVQGVGFRYTTAEIARRFAVTGWVRNLPDGRVELLAEGESVVLGEFLSAIAGHFQGKIQAEARTPVPPTGKYADFRISHT
jgi:acylphosphatase